MPVDPTRQSREGRVTAEYPVLASRSFVNLLGVKLTPIRMSELTAYVCALVRAGCKEIVNCINVHKVNLSFEHPSLVGFLNASNVVFADGAGVMLGARMLGQRVPERMQYGDWLWHLADQCEQEGHSLYFLGCRRGVADKAAAVLLERFPALKIVGTDHGYFKRDADHPENRAVIQRVNAAAPDILIVGLGRPAQELWLIRHWEELDATVGLTGGGAFDLISGELRRGPRILTDNGLEWLCRLAIEPRRLWSRYLVGNPLFLWRVLLQRLGVRRYEIRGSSSFWIDLE